MEINNYKEINLILGKKDYDYIAIALTPWHAYSILAAVMKLQNMNKQQLNGIIIIIKNSNESFLIDENYFIAINADCYNYNPIHSVKDLLCQEIISTYYCFTKRNNRKTEKEFYVLSQQQPHVLMIAMAKRTINDKNIVAVICDEGAGSYINTSKDRINIGKENNRSFLKYLKSIYEEYILIPLVSKKLVMSDSFFNMCLLKKKQNKVEINQLMSIYYKKSLEAHLKYTNFSAPVIEGKYVLVNTQPMTKEDMQDENEINSLWEEIIRLYIGEGYKVVVKPHPREKDILKYSKMGADVINEKQVAQELLLMKMKTPFILIGVFSTTLLTAPIFNDVNSVCLAPIVREMKSISRDYRSELDRFIDTFGNITKMISSIDELPI